MFKITSVLLSALISLSAWNAWSLPADLKLWLKTDDNWIIAYDHDSCMASTLYDNKNTNLMFFIYHEDAQISIGMIRNEWNLPKSMNIPMTVKFDKHAARTLAVGGGQQHMVIAAMDYDDTFLDQIADSSKMRITVNNSTWTYKLTGSKEAIKHLKGCAFGHGAPLFGGKRTPPLF